jgi:UDP-N-acetylmuramate--alanine ligase
MTAVDSDSKHGQHLPMVLDKATPVHFIGIAGVGMSALAKVLLARGFTVSGSDASENAYSLALQEAGATIFIGHSAAKVPSGAQVVVSTAIQESNPELAHARTTGLGVYHRSELLSAIETLFARPIAITGTHGKTTMTGMLGSILVEGGLDPTIIAGGKLPGFGTNAICGASSDLLVIESDESDGTMARYRPAFLVIGNLEFDHPDHYPGGLEAVIQAFQNYLRALPYETTVFFNVADLETRRLYEQFQGHVRAIPVYCGEPDADELDRLDYRPDYWLENITLHAEGAYQAQCWHRHGQLGQCWLQVPGKHNVANALLTIAVAHTLDVPFVDCRRALENFKGMGRRFDKLANLNGAIIIDDYAHHPTEVAVTLQAAKDFNQQRGRVIAIFQPHRCQRFESLWSDFLLAFERADEVVILDVYAAGEDPIEGISAQRFVEQLREHHPCVEYWSREKADFETMAKHLASILTFGDLLVLMGAGDITQLAHQVASYGKPLP